EVALVERLGGDELTEQLTGLDEARVVEDKLGLRLLGRLGRARLEREVVPVVRRGPAVTSAHRDRSAAGRLELVDRRVELVERLRRRGDARLREQLGVVPEARDAEGVRQAVGLAVELPRVRDRAEGSDLVRDISRDVLDVTRGDLRGKLARAPLLEQVGGVAREQRVRDERALELLVLEGLDVDRDARVRLGELLADLRPEGDERLAGRVVPPRDRLLAGCV